MDKSEVPKTVTTILNGHNYVLWSQNIRNFLKRHRLWRYVMGEIQALVRSKDEETRISLIVLKTRIARITKSSLGFVTLLYLPFISNLGHLLSKCPTIQYRYCHKIDHIVYNCPTKPPKPGQSGILPRPVNHFVATIAKELPSYPSLPSNLSLSSVSVSNTWYFDSACCNHMSPDSQLFSSVIPTTHAPLIQTANGSYIAANHIGSVSTLTLSLSDTYLIPNLTLNLISVGQLCEPGIIIQRSCARTSQQNGRAERKHRHILDSVRAFLIYASYPKCFLGEAALTAVYTINRLPSPALQNLSPFERLYGTSPSYSSFHVFDCACFVLLQSHEHSKLEPRSRLCYFLGYGIEHKGYHYWDLISQRLRISRHVVFWEHTTFNFLSKFKACSTPSYFTNPSLPLFPHDTSPYPSAILPIPPADSPSSPLAPPPVVNPVIDQTSLLPPIAPLDLPLAAPPPDSPISP
uniref:Retrotransposon Copia-like N-terminal domain-containing protein n=1 Tax=Fagus sylvatica TaxID=28930 RepID=A0A2N9GQF7_FAGSY